MDSTFLLLKRRRRAGLSSPLLLLATALTLCGCAKTITVTVPPRVDLKAFSTIGLIEFDAQPPGELGPDATQKFLGNLQAAQPGVRVLELGSRDKVLYEVGMTDLDSLAVRAIGEKYGVEAVLSGSVELSEIQPDVRISSDLSALTAQVKIGGKMSGKLWESANGATIWTNSSWGSWSVAKINLAEGGTGSFSYRNPSEKRNQILMSLVRALNGDFWSTYETRKVEE
jgi:hypothetical protein